MLTYLEMQLNPDAVKHGEGSEEAGHHRARCHRVKNSQQLRADALPMMKIGLAWLFETKSGAYWHNGGTGGYSSYASFQPNEGWAAVVLFNTRLLPRGALQTAWESTS